MDFKKLENQITIKAWKDPKFKKKLLDDPRSTIESFYYEIYGEKMNFPDHLNVQVIETPADTISFLLPAQPAKMKKLSDAELESLSAAGCCSEGWSAIWDWVP